MDHRNRMIGAKGVMTVIDFFSRSVRSKLLFLVLLTLAALGPTARGQEDGGEHSQHHPGQAGGGQKEKGGGMMGA